MTRTPRSWPGKERYQELISLLPEPEAMRVLMASMWYTVSLFLYLNQLEFAGACRRISAALRPGGALVISLLEG
jgi:hypothetical protein